ncbi:MAG: hypothetical protein CL866_02110 [Cycloclasticus sp.]|jgi:hypothetical protein|nr:hypothetical protein [Cycloclasticus sp.]MBG95654.1 hypothetical protein [Cycloclasticus sp.]|tara:strand:+ start:676 stop:1305 length:630 start_codon:yes stop_codon:yes gene_type:complete
MTFIQELRQQRWDDHRFYHHNRVNQFLHLLSAVCFLTSYGMLFINPVISVMVGWLLAMGLRQTGHFFFEPKTYDEVNRATHEYKESVKVGYNLHRKIILLAVWILSPAILLINASMFGFFEMPLNAKGYLTNMAYIWLLVGIGAIIFRTTHLFFLMGVQSGLVWAFKILTDPIHDVYIYYKSPYYLLKGDMYDEMDEWYEPEKVVEKSI